MSLTLGVHGESGAGKSYLADTAPAPRLVLDVEGGVQFTPSRKIVWDPKNSPPEVDGTWDTAVVLVRDVDTIKRVFPWLQQGKHPFKSVVIDSLTEVQKRYVDVISGTEMPKLQDYGELARRTEALVRGFRDLTMHPVAPVEVVVFVCGSAEKGQEHTVVRPMLIGSMAEKLAYNLDVMVYLSTGMGAEGELERRGQFVQVNDIAAKDRTGLLGVFMEAPSIPAMLARIESGIKAREGGE